MTPKRQKWWNSLPQREKLTMMNIILAIIATISATNGSGNIAANCVAITAVVTKWNVPIATR